MNNYYTFQNLKAGLFVVIILLSTSNAVAQGPSEQSYVTKVTPPSPNAAALAKYGDIPVSYYTGIPNIDIPLYVAQSGDIQLPISLSYHAGGVKINEEAGWTGLGWTLNAGGIVSRSINDKDDLTATYFTTQVPEMMQRATFATKVFGSVWNTNFYYGQNGAVYDWNAAAVSNMVGYDLEADLFTFNFNGRSGKFAFTRAQQIIQEKKSDLLIEGTSAGFQITDENGIKYIFAHAEMTDNGTQVLPTSWYLSKIYSPKGDSISFNYFTAAPASFIPRYSEIYRKGCNTPVYSFSYSTTAHQIKYLTSITFRNGHVDFEYENVREDMQVVTAGRKLMSIKVYNNTEALPFKRFDFTYSYFNNTLGYQFKRLKLDKVTEKGSDGSSLPAHDFVYEEVPASLASISGKNSFSVDHWGYFNGAPNTGLTPGYVGLATWGASIQLHTTHESIQGANRETNPSYSNVFSLKEIVYPTGGKTAFEYESNTFDRDISTPQGQPLDILQQELVNKQQQIQISTTGTTTGSIDFTNKFGPVEMTITFRCTQNNGCANVKSSFAYGSVYFQALGITRDLMGTELTCNPLGPICTTTLSNLDVPNNVQSWSGFIAPAVVGLQEITVIFRWAEPVTLQPTYVNANHFLYGGGLRVKQMTNYSDVGKVASIKKFEYHYSEDKDNNGTAEIYSYGRRMSPPSYYRNEILTDMWNNHQVRCPVFTRTSNSVSNLGSIGYDKVIEYNTDGTGTIVSGKTEYQFHNQIDSLISYRYPLAGEDSYLVNLPIRKPGIRNLSYSLNGTVKSKIIYKSEGSGYRKLVEENNYYSTPNRQTLYNLTYEEIYASDAHMYLTSFYPAIRSEFIRLDSTVVRNFPITEAQYLTASTYYFYENPAHVQPTRILNYGSEGNIVEKRNRYTQDNIAGLSTDANNAKNSLVAKHIINPVLESETIENGQAQVVRTNYKIFSPSLTLPDNVETKFGGGAFDKRAEFLSYDTKGNLLSQRKTSDVESSYIWGYNSTLPIAEAINAKSNEIFFTSFEETEGNTASGDAYCGDFSRTGGYSKTVTNLTTNTTYVLTYWQKTSGQWNVISSEFTLTSPTTSYNINLSGQVDDVRLYPKAAQITTYTYFLNRGISSVLDPNNVAQYFEYDSFGRLKSIRDYRRSILKSFVYNYQTH